MKPIFERRQSWIAAVVFAAIWVLLGLDRNYWSQGIFFALAWLTVASSLILSSRDVAHRFIVDLKFLTRRDESFHAQLDEAFQARLKSSRFLFFSVPLVAGIVVLTVFSRHFPEQLLTVVAAFTLAMVFAYAGKGFWGVCMATLLIHRVCRDPLYLDPFYPDGKGGFTIPEDFLHKVGWYFFSGGLLLPMAFEFGRGASDSWIKLLVAAFLLLFFVTGVSAMIYGKSIISLAYESARRREMRATARRMRELIENGGPADALDSEEKRHASLEKMSHPGADRYRLLAVIPQLVAAALPLASYGDEALFKFVQEVSRIIAPS